MQNDNVVVTPKVTVEQQDTYLSSLYYCAQHHGSAISIEQLAAGLATLNKQLTLASVEIAAQRANLHCEMIHKSIFELPAALLPAIVIDSDDRAVVVTNIDAASKRLSIVGNDQQSHWSALDQLAAPLTQQLIVLSGLPTLDERTPAVLSPIHQHWFWQVMIKNSSIYRDVFIASLLINLFALASPLFVMNVYDKVVPNLAMESLWVLTSGIAIVFLFDFVLRQLRSYFIDVAGKKIDLELAAKIFSKVLGIDYAARPKSVGAFASHIQSFESIRDFITSTTLTTLIDVPFAVIFLLIIWFVAGPVVYVPLAIIALLLVYAWWLQKPLNQAINQSTLLAAKKQALVVESLLGLEQIKLSNGAAHYQSEYEQTVAYISYWDIKMRKLMSSVSSLSMYLNQMSVVLVVVTGVYLVAQGTLSMGGIIAGVMLTGRAINPFSQLSILSTRYNHAKSALMLLDGIVNSEQEQDLSQAKLSAQWRGKLCLRDVSFSYPQSEQTRLNKLNITINVGEKIGIIGRVGAGKSTLLKLFSGLYKPSTGQYLFDDLHVEQLELTQLRRNVGCVSQDTFLLYGSIRDNITLGNVAIDRAKLDRAVALSGVGEFCRDNPQGLDQQVGERGELLSGGQRQAICIARAFYLQPPVLLLDEPTSSMDSRSEHDFIMHLKRLPKTTTVVLTTHKNSMLAVVDRLIVLDDGKVVADGPKSQVLAALNNGQVSTNTPVQETANVL